MMEFDKHDETASIVPTTAPLWSGCPSARPRTHRERPSGDRRYLTAAVTFAFRPMPTYPQILLAKL